MFKLEKCTQDARTFGLIFAQKNNVKGEYNDVALVRFFNF